MQTLSDLTQRKTLYSQFFMLNPMVHSKMKSDQEKTKKSENPLEWYRVTYDPRSIFHGECSNDKIKPISQRVGLISYELSPYSLIFHAEFIGARINPLSRRVGLISLELSQYDYFFMLNTSV
jgi:hypothetical protein